MMDETYLIPKIYNIPPFVYFFLLIFMFTHKKCFPFFWVSVAMASVLFFWNIGGIKFAQSRLRTVEGC